jgi:hypothetical protein
MLPWPWEATARYAPRGSEESGGYESEPSMFGAGQFDSARGAKQGLWRDEERDPGVPREDSGERGHCRAIERLDRDRPTCRRWTSNRWRRTTIPDVLRSIASREITRPGSKASKDAEVKGARTPIRVVTRRAGLVRAPGAARWTSARGPSPRKRGRFKIASWYQTPPSRPHVETIPVASSSETSRSNDSPRRLIQAADSLIGVRMARPRSSTGTIMSSAVT